MGGYNFLGKAATALLLAGMVIGSTPNQAEATISVSDNKKIRACYFEETDGVPYYEEAAIPDTLSLVASVPESDFEEIVMPALYHLYGDIRHTALVRLMEEDSGGRYRNLIAKAVECEPDSGMKTILGQYLSIPGWFRMHRLDGLLESNAQENITKEEYFFRLEADSFIHDYGINWDFWLIKNQKTNEKREELLSEIPEDRWAATVVEYAAALGEGDYDKAASLEDYVEVILDRQIMNMQDKVIGNSVEFRSFEFEEDLIVAIKIFGPEGDEAYSINMYSSDYPEAKSDLKSLLESAASAGYEANVYLVMGNSTPLAAGLCSTNLENLYRLVYIFGHEKTHHLFIFTPLDSQSARKLNETSAVLMGLEIADLVWEEYYPGLDKSQDLEIESCNIDADLFEYHNKSTEYIDGVYEVPEVIAFFDLLKENSGMLETHYLKVFYEEMKDNDTINKVNADILRYKLMFTVSKMQQQYQRRTAEPEFID